MQPKKQNKIDFLPNSAKHLPWCPQFVVRLLKLDPDVKDYDDKIGL